METEKTLVMTCERCLRQAVCIIYHGYGQLELRYGPPCSTNSEDLMHNLSEALALKCGHYMEADDQKEQ
jgi:hypothetical protein